MCIAQLRTLHHRYLISNYNAFKVSEYLYSIFSEVLYYPQHYVSSITPSYPDNPDTVLKCRIHFIPCIMSTLFTHVYSLIQNMKSGNVEWAF